MSSRNSIPTLIPILTALALGCAPTAKSPDTAASSGAESAEEEGDADSEELDEESGDSAGADETDEKSEGELSSVQRDSDSAADTRTLAVVGEVVKKNRQIVRDCYESALKKSPDLKGSLTIHFVLDAEGYVMNAELNQERSEITTPEVVDCAINLIKSLKFPPSSRGMETIVNYPFDLQPQK